jgi:hypothetical protein
MSARRRCLRLSKGRHRYVFWYYAGQELEVMTSLIGMVGEAGGEFDWFDAAVLTYEVAEPEITCEREAVGSGAWWREA